MLIKTARVALLLFLAAMILGPEARHAVRASEDWRPVSKEHLALKNNPAIPGAAAMIL